MPAQTMTDHPGARQIRELREQAGLTQQQLADEIKARLHRDERFVQATVSRAEAGRYTLKTAVMIARYFGQDPQPLMRHAVDYPDILPGAGSTGSTNPGYLNRFGLEPRLLAAA